MTKSAQRKPDKDTMPPMMMRAAITQDSLNEDKRTADVVWSIGSPVLRHDWWSGDTYYEELSLDPAHVRLDRLNNGAPLLNSHASYDLSNVIGVVVAGSARVEGGKGYATVQFSAREDVKDILQDVREGIIQNISVGYRVYKYEEIRDAENKIPTRRAIDWEPFEVSAVPIGADDGAGFRSDEKAHFNHVEIVTRDGTTTKEPTMTEEEKRAAEAAAAATRAAAPATPPAPAAVVVDVTAERAAGATAERERASGIRLAVRAAKLEDSVAERLITEGVSLDAARAQVLDALAAASDKTPTTSHVRAEVGNDLKVEGFQRGAENALMHRFQPGAVKLDDAGREYRGMSLLEIGRESLEMRGVKTRGMSKQQVAQASLGLIRSGGMHTTSDFPEVMANVAGKTLRRAYELKGQTFRTLGREVTLPDFKQVSRVQLGEAPTLKKIVEGGEYTRGTTGDSAEKYQLGKYGRILAITWEAIINDDMDAFTRFPAAFGASAADLESDLFYEVLTANAAMADGVALFHATHGNLGTTGSVFGQTSLSETRTRLRKMKASDKKKFLNLIGKTLVLPPELETTAFKEIALVTPNQTSGVNPFAGAFDVVVEPRLTDAAAWYMFADPAIIDTIEFGYLEGEQGPQIEQRVGFDVDGLELKCRSTFVAKAIDWRGIQKNTGAA